MATVQNGRLFSSGNHSVEITKGMLHFGDPNHMVCVLNVPTTMNVTDVINFLSPVLQDVENTRIIREVNLDSSYMVLLTFRAQEPAKQFYQSFNGIQFNSLEENTCKLLYVTRIETFSEDTAKLEESSNCAVCLDRMHSDIESIVTILCNHSFHAYCLNKWSDTSCPVCRYCQTPECRVESKCMDCSYEGESLWMCIICGYVACGRYINGHAYDHFTQTQHTYAMQLTDNQVWDYAGDNYVHRLLTNKTDGKPVEIEGAEGYRQAEEKIEAVQLEYTFLLTQQLESQRKYYERLLKDCEKQGQKKLKDALAKQKKSQDDLNELQERHSQLTKDKSAQDKQLAKAQTKLVKSQSALQEEKQISKCLTLNQEQFQQKLGALEKKLDEKNAEIADLKEQLNDLMLHLGASDKFNDSIDKNTLSRAELDNSCIVVTQASTSGINGGGSNSSRNNRRRKNR